MTNEEQIAEARGLVPDFERVWGSGKRSVNIEMIERLADALEAATVAAPPKPKDL